MASDSKEPAEIESGGPEGRGRGESVGCTEVLITLVHGTWAHGLFRRKPNGPDWYDQDGLFTRSLTRLLAERGIHAKFLAPCIWSGRNSMSARRACAASIIRSQRKASRSYPGVPRIVIAHSHGGTSVIAALRSLQAKHAPAGVVTLASPFISTEERAIPQGDRLALMVAGFALRIGMVASAWFIGSSILRFFLHDSFLEAHQTIATILLASIVIFLNERFFGLLPEAKNRSRRQRRRALQMSGSKLGGSKLFVVRATADEASLALGIGDAAEVAHGLARRAFIVPRIATRLLAQGLHRVGMRIDWMFNVMMVGVFLFLAYLPFQDVASDAGYSWLGLVPFFLVVVPMSLISAVAIPVIIASAILGVLAGVSLLLSGILSFLSYGPEYPFLGWDVRTTAETSPPGHTVPCHSLRLRSRGRLRHGIYRHLRTRKVIADWISQTFSVPCNSQHVRAIGWGELANPNAMP